MRIKPKNFILLVYAFFSFIFSTYNIQVSNQGIVMSDEIVMTMREVAQFLKLTEKTAYRFALEGKIPGFKVGGAWRFRRDEIERLTRGEPVERIRKLG